MCRSWGEDCTAPPTLQIRQLYQALPSALARDEPQAAALVAETLRSIPLAELHGKDSLERASESAELLARDALEALRASAANDCRRRSSLQRADLTEDDDQGGDGAEQASLSWVRAKLQHRSILRVKPVEPRAPSRWDRWMLRLRASAGVSSTHLRIATQTCVSYLVIMLFTAIEPIYDGLFKRTGAWAWSWQAGARV